MNHGRFEELLALALYDELAPHERAELDAHLAACDACRARERELDRGLGRLARGRATVTATSMPADWDAALARAIAAEPRADPGTRRSAAWPSLASFAAGLLATWLLMHGGAPDASRAEPPQELARSSPWSRFHADEAPPRATSAGSLGRLVAARR